jgi:hypothetical protein
VLQTVGVTETYRKYLEGNLFLSLLILYPIFVYDLSDTYKIPSPDQLSLAPPLKEIIFSNKPTPFSFSEMPTSPVDVNGITVLNLSFDARTEALEAKLRFKFSSSRVHNLQLLIFLSLTLQQSEPWP